MLIFAFLCSTLTLYQILKTVTKHKIDDIARTALKDENAEVKNAHRGAVVFIYCAFVFLHAVPFAYLLRLLLS